MQNIIFVHGLVSSGKGFKGQFFRKEVPECLTPDFKEFNPKISTKVLLEKRMKQLNSLLKDKENWIIIGSSFGGLMGALYALQNPKKVSKLILLAPYLSTRELNPKEYTPIAAPVIVYHGKHDNIVSLNRSRTLAEKLFINITYNIVDDDHSLHKTVKTLDWKNLIKIV